MHFSIITLFPEMFDALHYGITGRAIKQTLITIDTLNPRDFSKDARGYIDDRPFGGGPGMVMQYQPLHDAIQAAKLTHPDAKVVYLSPQGQVFNHPMAFDAAQSHSQANYILLCGRYEGIDERVIIKDVDEEWSVGDYVLSGGELPAMIVIDAITRLIPGALGHQDSASQDSFANGLLDYPQYTRPAVVDGMRVPDILLSGDHQAISAYRQRVSEKRTWQKRSDLVKIAPSPSERKKS